MKKRKVKLFASIASLGLVVAVMGVGVWAATQQAVKVSSQVSFTATSVAADITLQVHNNKDLVTGNPNTETGGTGLSTMDIVDKASLALTEKEGQPISPDAPYEYDVTKTLTNTGEGEDTATPGTNGVEQYVARFINDTEKSLFENRVYLNIADKDEDGYLNVGAEIVYEFKIKALESSAPIYYDITANLFDTKIKGTNYTINQVFDVTVTDTKEGLTTTPTDTTLNETDTIDTVHITNWTTGGVADTTQDGNAIQPNGTGVDTEVGYGEVRTITVTYTVKDLAASDPTNFTGYQGISYTMKSLELGDIYIKVANNLKNLEQLPDYAEERPEFPFDTTLDWTAPKDVDPGEGTVDNGEDEGEEN